VVNWGLGGMSNGKLENIAWVVKNFLRKGPQGLVFEFGVFEGESLCFLVSSLLSFGLTHRVVGFDSFSGLPENAAFDSRRWAKGAFSSSYRNTYAQIAEHLGEATCGIRLVPGIYSDSLTKKTAARVGLPDFPLRFVHVDCDLYSSTTDVLQFLSPYFKVGTLLLFDEWLDEEKKAWEDFCGASKGLTYKEVTLPGASEQQLIKVTSV